MLIDPNLACVILVEPEDPRNVGFVARAMKCHDLMELRIVHPQLQSMPDEAFITGYAAKAQLQDAKFYTTLADALADIQYSVAFSRRHFEIKADQCWLRELPTKLLPVRTAFVFGRESQGLNHAEINSCSICCGIPVTGTMSYNLGQAAAIGLYEVFGRHGSIEHPPESLKNIAPHQQLEHFLKLAAQSAGADEASNTRRIEIIRALLLRAQVTEQEVKTLFGLLKTQSKA